MLGSGVIGMIPGTAGGMLKPGGKNCTMKLVKKPLLLANSDAVMTVGPRSTAEAKNWFALSKRAVWASVMDRFRVAAKNWFALSKRLL